MKRGRRETPEGSGEPVVVVKVVELTARGRVSRGQPAGGDKQCWRPGDRKKRQKGKETGEGVVVENVVLEDNWTVWRSELRSKFIQFSRISET